MRYRLPESGRLKLLSGSGSIHVIAEDRDDVEIDQPRAHVEVKDHVLEVHSKSGSVTARCPTGTRVEQLPLQLLNVAGTELDKAPAKVRDSTG